MVRADKIHSQTTDQIAEVLGPNPVRNNHEGEERDAGRKYQAVNENDETCFLQVAQLGMFNLSVNLRQSLLTAHCQDGMPQTDENSNESNGVGQPRVTQPAERIIGEGQISRRDPG